MIRLDLLCKIQQTFSRTPPFPSPGSRASSYSRSPACARPPSSCGEPSASGPCSVQAKIVNYDWEYFVSEYLSGILGQYVNQIEYGMFYFVLNC